MARPLTNFVAVIVMSLAFNSLADSNEASTQQYVAGKHYEVLDTPVRTSDPERIETTEVFWYGCGHCFTFEPTIEAWQKTLPDDVVFVQSPAIWHPSMELHARAFYAAKALGVLDTMHSVIFKAMNLKKNKLATESAIAELFADHGVNQDKFTKMFNSFGVTSAVKQAEARQRGYQIKGTPEVVVNGKYRVTAQMGGSRTEMMEIIDYLIGVERNSMKAKPDAS